MNLAELELLVDAYEVGKRRGQTVRTESDAELERRAYEISNLKSRIEELETAVEERTTVLGATYRDATNLVNLMGATLMVSKTNYLYRSIVSAI
jgi:phosphopantetheine adenylyltransferase